MIAAWMLYSVLVAGLLTIAGLWLERAVSILDRPRRWVWIGALGASVALPTVGLLGVDVVGPRSAVLQANADLLAGAVLAPLVASDVAAAVRGWGIDGILLAGWVVASTILLFRFARSYLAISRQRRGWRVADPGPLSVRISDEFGPAVVGLWRSEIVLPHWVLDLPPEERGLVQAHEAEHVRSGDVRVLVGARLTTIGLPWLLPLWWQLHRLRLAVEIDCDRRVLRAGIDRTRYGRLLLDVGRRRGAAFPVAALAERSSTLERRIRAMMEVTPRRRWLRAAIATAGAFALIAVACESPTPGTEGPASAGEAPRGAVVPDDSSDDGVPPDESRFVAYEQGPRLVNGEDVKRLHGEEYAKVREEDDTGGTVDVWIFVDVTGDVSQARVAESSGRDALDQAALVVARSMRFEPARQGDDPIGVWAKQPIQFRPEE